MCEPKASNLTLNAIERVASLVRKKYQFDDTYHLTRQLGEIILSPFNTFRDYFFVAHELGHYFLHYPEVNPTPTEYMEMKASRYGKGRIEREANQFAAALTMPKFEFYKQYILTNGSITELSNFFEVSISAVEFRINYFPLETI